MTQRTFIRAQLLSVLGMAFLIALPYFLYTLRPEYQGLVPFRTNDDGFYMGRLNTVLLGRWSEFQNGITGPLPGAIAPARGVAPALLELVFGTLFSWTRLYGPQLSILLTIVIAPLTIPLVVALLRSFGTGRGLALAGSLLYTFVFLSPLQRPVYMSLALPLSLLAMLLGVKLWQRPRPLLLFFAALLLGILPGVYFWSFSFVWAVCGFLFLLHLLFLTPSTEKKEKTRALLLAAALALILSSPFFMQMMMNSLLYPFSAELALRNQIIHTRMVESIPRSVLLTLLTIFSLFACREVRRDSKALASVIIPSSLILAAFAVMHQNLLHGLRFTFSSHYYPYVCLVALSMGVWSLNQSKLGSGQAQERAGFPWIRSGIVCIASVFLLAGAWDYRVAWILPTAPRNHLDLQHLAPALQILKDGRRETVLTDYRSAQMVTNWTEDDVVFTPYVRHLLVSNQEFAERYCLSESQNSDGPDIHWIASETTHIYAREFLPEREKEFGAFCGQLLSDPRGALKRYGVDLLLWNKRERPLWHIDPKLFKKVAEGEGWSLYRITSVPG